MNFEYDYEEYECETCGWIGYPKTYTVKEDTDADGNRGRWVRYVICGNKKCQEEVGFQQW